MSHHTIPGEVGRQRGNDGKRSLLMTSRTELAKVVSMPTEHQFLQAALRGTSRSLPCYLGDPGHYWGRATSAPTHQPWLTKQHTYIQMLLFICFTFLSSPCRAGISGKSQILFALVFTTRYLDLFTNFISVYNTVMKVRRGQCSRKGSSQLAVVSRGGEGTQSLSLSARKGG